MVTVSSRDLEKRTALLLSAPVPIMLWRVATPNVAATIIMTGITFFDALFVSTLGNQALASLALVFPFQALMQMMAVGAIGGGITSAVARAIGGGNLKNAELISFHALLVGAFMSLLFIIILGLLAEDIFRLLSDSESVIQGAVTYAQIAFGGAAFSWLFFNLSSILRGSGDTITPAKAMIWAGGFQVILSGLLTLGFIPFLNLGIAGPATALVVCHAAGAIYLLTKTIGSHSLIKLRVLNFNKSAIMEILKVGGLGLINSITIVATIVFVTGFVSNFGTSALAGYGLASRLELMLVPIAFGIGAALTAAVGTNIGAGQYYRARYIAKFGAFITFIMTGIIGLAVAAMPWLWLDLFTDSEQSIVFASTYLLFVAPFYGLFSGGMTLYFASQGTGKMGLPVLVNIIRLLTVLLVGCLTIIFEWNINCIFISVGLGLAITGVGQFLCLYSAAWNK
jgi:putative MATE family efflux protein